MRTRTERARVRPSGAARPKEKLERATLALALEDSQDSVALFDAAGCLVLCNGGYGRLIGADAAALVGRRHEELFDAWLERSASRDADTLAKLLVRRQWLQRPEQSSVLEFRTQDGAALRVIDRRTMEGGYVETIKDLTEDERRAEELRTAQATAERASQAKSEFLSSVNHELRTPLNAVLGFAQLLVRDKHEPLSPRHRQRVEQIAQSGAQLLHLIDDILELSRLDERQLAIASEPVRVEAIVAHVRRALEPSAKQRDVVMEIDPAVSHVPVVAGDRKRITQCLLNLGSNALKYNRSAGRVIFGASAEQPGRVRITVRDTGIGIPEAKQALVFQPFERAGQESGPIEGAGVGLALTRRLARLMGGDVGFRSEAGLGSEFWIELRSWTGAGD